jgi:hypothetical protein
MASTMRIIAVGGAVGTLIAGSLAGLMFLQSAAAEEPAKAAAASFSDLFPKAPPFDPRTLRKFAIVVGPSVSTDVEHSTIISKIEHGHRSFVTVITTASGTYSSDGLASPYIKYPGIDVDPIRAGHRSWALPVEDSPLGWSSVTSGSITYFTYGPITGSNA